MLHALSNREDAHGLRAESDLAGSGSVRVCIRGGHGNRLTVVQPAEVKTAAAAALRVSLARVKHWQGSTAEYRVRMRLC